MLISWLWLASLLSVPAMAVTPMEKVKSLLADLKKEIEAEAVVEAQNFAEFERWCDLEAQQCANDIAGAKTRIAEHKSNIDEAKAGITRLGYEMEKLAMQVSHKEEDLAKSTALREKEHADFITVYDTLQNSADVLDKALKILSKVVSKETLLQAQHALSFVLRQTNAVGDAPDQMQNFFQQVAVEPLATQHTFLMQEKQPVQGAVYEGKSNQVKSVIQSMKDDITEQQRAAGKDEETKAHAFDMYKQSMENELKGLKKEIDNVRMQDAALNEKVAQEEQARTDAATYLEDTEKYLTDTKTNCEEKGTQWEIRTKGREEEMGAIDEATKVLSSDRADEMRKYERGSPTTLSQVGSEVRIPSFFQVGSSQRSGLSFLQVRRGGGTDALTQRMVHAMQADPFGKVKKMIENMVVKLLEEQAQEQEHKAWCDAETAKTTKQEKYHARNSQKFNSRIEEMTAEIAELNEGIQDRSQDLDQMNTAFAEATEIREAEKKEATTALKDYADAQQMLQKAIQVLTDFYQKQRASAASAAMLLQQKQGATDGSGTAQPQGTGNAAPNTFEGTDAAASREGAAQNILNILEISLSDFTKLESETQTEEEAAQKEYETYQQEYRVQKAVAEKEREHFTVDLAKLEESVKTTSKDLAEVDKELAAAREYLDKLKTTCDFSGSSYEERQARREAELKSLQNALAIISGEAIP